MGLVAGALAVIGATVASADGRGPAYAWAVIFGLVGLTAGAALMLRTPAPDRHPVWRRITLYGDPTIVSREIDREVESGASTTIQSLTVTPGWLVHRRMFGIDLARLEDVMWAYRSDTRYYMNGIKTGKAVEVCVHLRDGSRWKLAAGGADAATAMLEAVAAVAPWTTIGYSDELKAIWTSGRGEWIAAVDERRHGSVSEVAGASPGTRRADGRAQPRAYPSGRARTILGLGIAGLLVPIPCALIALYLGHKERRQIADGIVLPSNEVTIGWALGIAGVGYLALMALAMLAVPLFAP
jgi:hypothetical protein